MAMEVKIPEVGESIYEAQIIQWLKQEGDWVEEDEELVEIETDKATIRVPAPASGTVTEILKKDGEICEIGAVIAHLDESQKKPKGEQKKKEQPEEIQEEKEKESEPPKQTKPAPVEPRPAQTEPGESEDRSAFVMPAAARLLKEHDLAPDDVEATGPGGRLLKEDVIRHLEQESLEKSQQPGEGKPDRSAAEPRQHENRSADGREEQAVPMSMIRRRVADRLVEARKAAALLTTVNEIDMAAVIELRQKYREKFEQDYGVKLGFMSFFVKAAVEGLKLVPELNAEIRDRNIIYRNYYDVGIAVGADKGLVVPVIRNAERMSFAEIEQAVDRLAARARQHELTPQDLKGGTFSITNGGVYGSLLSTPIVNPPQSGILAMHVIQDRPVARQGQVVIRPMMYGALTYDHRIVDGREAIGFLRRVKEIVEDPPRMLLEV